MTARGLAAFEHWAQRFGGRRVVVVGDLIVDAYVRGTSSRLSPEAPVPVVRTYDEWDALGGAANVAHQLAALGAVPLLFGVVGPDEVGERLVELCEDSGLWSGGVVVDPSRRTTRKLRVLTPLQQVVRVDWEDTHPLGHEVALDLMAALSSVSRPDAVVVSDYAKGAISDTVLASLAPVVAAWDVPFLVDPKGRPVSDYRGATGAKLNREEFEAELGRPLGDLPEVAVAATGPDARRRAGVDHLVVTLGDRGMVVVDGDDPRHHPTTSRDVYDVSGAGDTVIAVLALGASVGMPIDLAAELANLAGSVAVGKVGVSTVSTGEILAEARRSEVPASVESDGLDSLLASWRADGRRIVLTNGCFDLLHAGHIELLGAASSEGDVLVVAINSDDSVRRLKGAGRPAIGAAERCALVASVPGVDAVVTFEGEDLLDVIDRIRPDVLVKGADYRLDQVVGRTQVEAAGGRVVLVPLLPGHSTTAELERSDRAQLK